MSDWSKHDFALIPLTKDLLDSLSMWERDKALKAYELWRERERLNDKKELKNQNERVRRFKNHEKALEVQKKWRENNRERCREYQREYRRKKRGDGE